MSKRRLLLPVGLVISTGLLGIFLLTGCSAAPPSIQTPVELPETPSPVTANPPQKTPPSETPLAQPTPTFSLVEAITEEPVTTQPGESIPQDAYIVDLIQQAKQDLSQRINTPLEEIETIGFEEVSWPDFKPGLPAARYGLYPGDGRRLSHPTGSRRAHLQLSRRRQTPPLLVREPGLSLRLAASIWCRKSETKNKVL